MKAITKFALILSLVTIIEVHVKANFYINLENVNTENSAGKGASIGVNKVSELRTVCVRFMLVRTSNPHNIFFTPNAYDLVLLFMFEGQYGFLRVNGKSIIFDFPDPIVPYIYQNFCFSWNEKSYSVACNGILWYSSELQETDIQDVIKPVNISMISFGPVEHQVFAAKYLLGRVSQLNLFSNSFSEKELTDITRSCSETSTGNKIFDWSRIGISDIDVPQDVDIRYYYDSLIKLILKVIQHI